MSIILETERLRLREFTLDDSGFILELLNTEGWLTFIGDRNVRTEEDARQYLQNGPIQSYENNGFGLYAVELSSERIPIGMCGIIKRDTLEHPDIGFAFLPEFSGKGYAFESAAKTVEYANNVLKLPVLYAIVLPSNASSIRLLEKIGLKFYRTIRLDGDNEELQLFSNHH